MTRALVTGAAGAIGGAIARELHGRGMRLTLVDRDEEKLHALAKELRAEAAVWDLAQPEALAPIDTDLLVNCAGIMDMQSLAATDWARAQALLSIDLISPLRLMHLAVPAMIARRHGGIINIASMAGVTPLRGTVFYGAAKAGLAMASEVARLELRGHGIRVVTVYPGPVHSALEKRSRSQLRTSLIARLLPTGDAAQLARLVVQAYDRDHARVVYPALYSAANRIPRISGWVTGRWSPMPVA